ncbi:MAG: acyltransferase [Oscillospiraceae bacterium]|jgi:surface polysaccharide O-acyltransferase-like enzyme|nr:acyltransferase [Oscillospiraceae bacterium]
MSGNRRQSKEKALLKPPRESNFELFRIFCMLMIVTYHYMLHGEIPEPAVWGVNKAVWVGIQQAGFGRVGVEGFLLIAGYFGCTAQKFRAEKWVRIELQMLFYSIGLAAVFVGLGLIPTFEWKVWFFPFSRALYWFATCYIMLMLLSPFLNSMLQNLSQKMRLALVLGWVFFYCVWPMLYPVRYLRTESMTYIGNFCGYLGMYVIGAYVRLHPTPKKILPYLGLSAFGFLLIETYPKIRMLLLSLLPDLPKTVQGKWYLPTVLCAVSLFLLFKNLPIKPNRTINLISSATFGVYLLHSFPYMPEVLWTNVFHTDQVTKSGALPLNALLAVSAVFTTGILMDLFRQYALEKPLFRLVDSIKARLLPKISKRGKEGET